MQLHIHNLHKTCNYRSGAEQGHVLFATQMAMGAVRETLLLVEVQNNCSRITLHRGSYNIKTTHAFWYKNNGIKRCVYPPSDAGWVFLSCRHHGPPCPVSVPPQAGSWSSPWLRVSVGCVEASLHKSLCDRPLPCLCWAAPLSVFVCRNRKCALFPPLPLKD